MFDISTNTKADKRNYRNFRKYILRQGFIMYQYSVYYRVLSSQRVACEFESKINTNSTMINGDVSCLVISARQYNNIRKFGKKKNKDRGDQNTEQLSFF